MRGAVDGGGARALGALGAQPQEDARERGYFEASVGMCLLFASSFGSDLAFDPTTGHVWGGCASARRSVVRGGRTLVRRGERAAGVRGAVDVGGCQCPQQREQQNARSAIIIIIV